MNTYEKLHEVFKELSKIFSDNPDSNCLHDNCEHCHGTGIKKDGTSCIHMISCPCPKCNPTC